METRSRFRVLVLSKTAGYRHESIPAGIEGIKKVGASGKFTVDASEDSTLISVDHLRRYAVVVFLQTSGDFLNQEQLGALKTYMKNGGGFVGIHCAASAMFTEPWYGELIGAIFTDHPEPQKVVVRVEKGNHCIVAGHPEEFAWLDEWYNFRANPSRDKVTVLLSIDEKGYEGGKMGDDHPLAWCQEIDGGRSFYTALGHFSEAYEDDKFMNHVLNGILWAAGMV
ncbi:Uu.00g133040.m01.CDS01 [Anthostomella pinea]|uniref:Uu.00g133040.m01.CDS01 n=1 Tax=Anthostomella pinea TaxID=933095 RepID=A0AAI8VTK6_9PEZI|nr:Uu.00g133040.m01.CDS01 [Anthostomella pinea]